jgi:hypothetical protein
MRPTTLILFTLTSVSSIAQDTAQKFSWSAYGEFYASYDALDPRGNLNSLPLLYNYKRTNTLALNIALVRAYYQDDKIRANAGIMFGDYSRFNLASEDISMRNIYELNASVKLLKNENLWLDAGVFESYLGFENPIGVNNATLTRSIFAENSPYYLSGLRLHYASYDSRFELSGYYLNGWQRMTRPTGMRGTAWGGHLQFRPTEYMTLSYGTFWGGDGFDRTMQRNNYLRWFNDCYLLITPTQRTRLGVLFDYGIDYANRNPKKEWYTFNSFFQYKLTPQWSMTARAEHYSDPNYTALGSFLPAIVATTRFSMNAYSLNSDIRLTDYATFRIEARLFESGDYILMGKRNRPANSTQLYTAAFCISF